MSITTYIQNKQDKQYEGEMVKTTICPVIVSTSTYKVNFNNVHQIHPIEQIYIMPDWFYTIIPVCSAYLSNISVTLYLERLQQFEKKYELVDPVWKIIVSDSSEWSYTYHINRKIKSKKLIKPCKSITIPIDRIVCGICNIEVDYFIKIEKDTNIKSVPLFATACFDAVELQDLCAINNNNNETIEIPDIFSGTLFTISNK